MWGEELKDIIVDASLKEFEGNQYTQIYSEIQIDEKAAPYVNQKVACRVKGWNSLIGSLSEWLVTGAIFKVG